jgi:DNA-binding MarR family transcriptional regulator
MKLIATQYITTVTTTDNSPLRLSDRIVYSYLGTQKKWGKGATVQDIADHTRLNRTYTVPQSLGRLVDLGLVEQADGRYFAMQPSGASAEWFVKRKGNDHWFNRLGYFVYYIPTTIDYKRAALLSLLYSFAKQVAGMPFEAVMSTNRQGLADLLHVSRNFVSTVLSEFESDGLIKVCRHKSNEKLIRVVCYDPPTDLFEKIAADVDDADDCFPEFMELIESPVEPVIDSSTEAEPEQAEPEPQEPEGWDDFLLACRAENIDDDCIRKLDAARWEFSLNEILDWLPNAKARHEASRLAGKFSDTPHCGYLLLAWLKKEEAEHQKKFDEMNELPHRAACRTFSLPSP